MFEDNIEDKFPKNKNNYIHRPKPLWKTVVQRTSCKPKNPKDYWRIQEGNFS